MAIERPNHAHADAVDAIPPGWRSNPSAWRERRWPLAFACVGLLAALYTGLSQVGVFQPMWDPFFGSASSYAVTHSFISRLLPVPDGLLGVVGYACDLIFGSLGGEQRWHRLPWATLIFGAVITALLLVGIALTTLQATVIGHWCTICLLSAASSLLVFVLGIREPIASLRYLALVWLEDGRRSAWHALWGMQPAQRPAHPDLLDGAPTRP